MQDIVDTVVYPWLAAGDAGNVDVFDDLLHRNVVVHAPAGLSTSSAEEEKAVWRDAVAAMPACATRFRKSWWTATSRWRG